MNQKRIGSAALLAAASASGAFLLGSSPAIAQGQSSSQSLLEEVVVTARRREESLQDLPLSIAAFNANQMEAQGIQSIEDVGDFVPNVTLTTADRANNTRIVIRGIGGGHPDPVFVFGSGMYIDGHYVPNSLGGYMSTVDIERVEVLRGPQGTLFGKNVTGGAVNIVSVKPGPDYEGSLSLRLAENGEQNLRGALNVPLTDSLYARVGIGKEDFDGYYYNRHLNTDVGGRDATTMNVALRWLPTDQWTIDFNSFLIKRRDGNLGVQCSELGNPPGSEQAAPTWGGFPGRVDRLFPGADQLYHDTCNEDASINAFTNSSEKRTFANIDQQSAFLTAQWDSDGAVGALDSMTVKFNGSYRYNDYDYMQDRDGSFLAIDAVGTFAGLGDIGQDNWTRGAEFLVEAQVNDRLDFTVGVNYFYEKAKNGDGRCREIFFQSGGGEIDLDNTEEIAPANPEAAEGFVCDSTSGLFFELLPDPRASGGSPAFMNQSRVENESIGVFGHLTYALTDNWDLDVGARWTEDDRNFWNMEWGSTLPCDTGIAEPGIQTLGNPSTTGSTDLCRGLVMDVSFDQTVGDGFFNRDSATFSEVTPMISLTRSLNPGNVIEDGMVYFLYSEGFLTGGFNTELNSAVPGVQELLAYDPENVSNFEVGFKGTFADGRVRINADVFLMDYQNKQESISIFNPNGAFGIDDTLGVVTNVSSVDISGIEFELRASPWDGGFVSVDFGLLNNEYADFDYANPDPGNPDTCDTAVMSSDGTRCDASGNEIIDLTPDWTLNLGLEHSFMLASGATLTPRVNIYSSGEIEYRDRLSSAPPTPCNQDSYSKVGARLSYEPAAANWRATIYGENLTDELIYEACGQSRGIWRYRHERPRWYGIEFSTTFGG